MMNSLKNLLFPPLCLHCKGSVSGSSHLFCEECSFFFSCINPEERCPYCFNETERKRACHECTLHKRWSYQVGSALIERGPVESFAKRIELGKIPFLAKTAASFLALQLDSLGWEIETLIDPTPIWRRVYFGRSLLALELGKVLQLPVAHTNAKKRIEDKNVAVITLRLDFPERESVVEKVFKVGPKRVYVLSLTTK